MTRTAPARRSRPRTPPPRSISLLAVVSILPYAFAAVPMGIPTTETTYAFARRSRVGSWPASTPERTVPHRDGAEVARPAERFCLTSRRMGDYCQPGASL